MARSYVREARRRGLGRRRERIGPIIERLAAEHADATIALRFRTDVELLVSVMLSAQTTDVTVNRVTERLFEKYTRPEDYLAVPQEELERDIYETGFFRQKAKSIRGAMRVLIEEFDGQVPAGWRTCSDSPVWRARPRTWLLRSWVEPQGIVVDTHVRRLSQRLGLTRQEDPVKIERDLLKVVPRADWHRFPHLLIWHGRRICDARRPQCESASSRSSALRRAWAEGGGRPRLRLRPDLQPEAVAVPPVVEQRVPRRAHEAARELRGAALRRSSASSSQTRCPRGRSTVNPSPA